MNSTIGQKRLYVACDLGAETGRVIVGELTDGRLAIEEVHRFLNEPIEVEGSLRWDVQSIFNEIKTGLKLANAFAANLENAAIVGVSINSWGVDYVLIREPESATALPYHYRDSRTQTSYIEAFSHLAKKAIFNETGIQFMPINTLYQLIAEMRADSGANIASAKLLLIADYFNYLLCGVACAEVSLASTTQLYNPRTSAWSERLINAFGIPRTIFPSLVNSGTILGPLLPEIAMETGIENAHVIATCSHDTAAAVAAIPAKPRSHWAYLSTGTWSLLGVERSKPLMGEDVRAANFTNEVGYGGSVRFLKNIVGLWILQECRREWVADGKVWDYEQLTQLAGQCEPLRSLIAPNDPRFARPGKMLSKIDAFCEETGQLLPETAAQVARCIFDSLALSYRHNLAMIQQLTGTAINALHIVGGGSQNRLLNQSASNATGVSVIAGPMEATAIGNLLLQAIALHDIDNQTEMRDIVRNSFSIEKYTPRNKLVWADAYQRYVQWRIFNDDRDPFQVC